jgi:hypothetical protein
MTRRVLGRGSAHKPYLYFPEVWWGLHMPPLLCAPQIPSILVRSYEKRTHNHPIPKGKRIKGAKSAKAATRNRRRNHHTSSRRIALQTWYAFCTSLIAYHLLLQPVRPRSPMNPSRLVRVSFALPPLFSYSNSYRRRSALENLRGKVRPKLCAAGT